MATNLHLVRREVRMTNRDQEDLATTRVPDLVKAALILFVINIILLLWFIFSPIPIAVSNRTQPAMTYANDDRLSPFTEVVDIHEKRRPVKAAPRLRPVLVQEQAQLDQDGRDMLGRDALQTLPCSGHVCADSHGLFDPEK